jgi:phospholipase C
MSFCTVGWRYFFAFSSLLIVTACNGGAISPARDTALPATRIEPRSVGPVGSYIKHVVLIVQENHSFDNLFARFPGADGTTYGRMNNGTSIKLIKSNLASNELLENSHQAFVVEYDHGKMDGFNAVYVSSAYCQKCAYEYVDPKQIQPYWTMAQQYVLADHMFPTESSGSFTAHQDLIRGNTAISGSESLIDFPSHGPWGCDAAAGTTTPLITNTGQYIQNGPAPCLTYNTVRDLLDAKGLSWRYYTPPLFTTLAGAYWNGFDAIKAVRYSPEWNKNISTPSKNIFDDIADGKLANVTWVIPDGVNSDHAGFGTIDTGPSWVAQVVNAVGRSRYWKSTAIIILWDDWGGWYDHVPPPQLDYAGLGFRVPMIVVSPYAKAGYVSHTRYEFGSVVRFVEEVYGLGSLGTTDTRAASIDDVFDFTQAPRTFSPIDAKYSKAFFQHQAASNVPVDTN